MANRDEAEFAADYHLTLITGHQGNKYNQDKMRDLMSQQVQCSHCNQVVKGKDARQKNGDLICPKCKTVWIDESARRASVLG